MTGICYTPLAIPKFKRPTDGSTTSPQAHVVPANTQPIYSSVTPVIRWMTKQTENIDFTSEWLGQTFVAIKFPTPDVMPSILAEKEALSLN